MIDEPPIKILSSRIDWESPWYRIRRDEICRSDGRQGVYNVLEMADSVFVVPFLPDGRVVLIRSYRHTLGEWTWELPAGGIKPGQTPEEAAADELREEIGGTASGYEFLLKACTMNGIGSHHAHFFLARNVSLSAPEPEAMEIISVHPMSLQQALVLARSGQMNDAISITALLLAQPLIASRP